MRFTLLTLLIFFVFSSVVSAEIGFLEVDAASAVHVPVPGNNDQCEYANDNRPGEWCRVNLTLAGQSCNFEGTYRYHFNAPNDGNPAGPHGGMGTNYYLNSHVVSWDTEKYCKGASDNPVCMTDRDVEWSASANMCCGARPARDCGNLVGGNLCAQTGGMPALWEWASHAENTGDIYEYQCANATSVSSGSQFYVCGDSAQLKSALPTAPALSISKGGGVAHGYVCAETVPTNPKETKGWIECRGEGAAYDRKSRRVVTTGDYYNTDQLFTTQITGDRLVNYSAQYNFNPTTGRIELYIQQRYSSGSTQPRTFLSIDDTSGGFGSYIRIRKEGNTLSCLYNQNAVTFDVSNKNTGSNTSIIFTWNAGSTFDCTVDGITKTATAGAAIAAKTITLADHPNGNEDAQSSMNLTILGSITPATYYCTSNALFTKNLDNLPPAVGDLSCTSAGLFFTGTKCCSEAEDQPSEYYGDNGGYGACWNSTGYPNGHPVSTENNRVIAVEGNWFGCNLDETDPILDLTDVHTTTPLVQSNVTCQAFANVDAPNNNFVCSMNTNAWIPSPSTLNHIIKEAPYETDVPRECCGIDSCWNGSRCIGNQINDSSDTVYEGYRCINGDWQTAVVKYTWDRANRGFCPADTDCLLHPAGDFNKNYHPELYTPGVPAESPACLASGQSVLSYQCAGGAWTSNTKYIALQLLDFAISQSPNDYSLFCEDWNELLNFVDYRTIQSGTNVRDYVEQTCTVNGVTLPCVNQFCALKYKTGTTEHIAFGTSLNIPVDHSTKSFLSTLGLDRTACNSVKNTDEDYDLCEDGTYYNFNTNSVIYVPSGTLSAKALNTLVSQHATKLTNPLDSITNFFANDPNLKGKHTFFGQSTLYNRIYLLHKGSKDYYGYFGRQQYNGSFQDYIGIEHNSFTTQDPDGRTGCDMSYAQLPTELPRGCSYQAQTLRLLTFAQSTGNRLRTPWRDLTAKLRVT